MGRMNCKICGDKIPETRPGNSKTCSDECSKENKRQIDRKWRKENKEKSKKYYRKNREKFKKYYREYYRKNREKFKLKKIDAEISRLERVKSDLELDLSIIESDRPLGYFSKPTKKMEKIGEDIEYIERLIESYTVQRHALSEVSEWQE